MVKYFPRYLITTAKHAVKIEPITCLGNYEPICLILPCAETNLYVTKYYCETRSQDRTNHMSGKLRAYLSNSSMCRKKPICDKIAFLYFT